VMFGGFKTLLARSRCNRRDLQLDGLGARDAKRRYSRSKKPFTSADRACHTSARDVRSGPDLKG